VNDAQAGDGIEAVVVGEEGEVVLEATIVFASLSGGGSGLRGRITSIAAFASMARRSITSR
jgi:hypothetical protein